MTLQDAANMSTVVTGVAAVLGLVVALFAYHQWLINLHQLGMQMMTHFHERYSEMYDVLHHLPIEFDSYDALSQQEKHAISNYVNMCSEQFYWKTQNRIDARVWNVWEHAMREKFKISVIQKAWVEIHHREHYYEGFEKFVDTRLVPPHQAEP